MITFFFPLQHGETIFHLAASGGHLEVIQYLQTKDVDLEATDKVRSFGVCIEMFGNEANETKL